MLVTLSQAGPIEATHKLAIMRPSTAQDAGLISIYPQVKIMQYMLSIGKWRLNRKKKKISYTIEYHSL